MTRPPPRQRCRLVDFPNGLMQLMFGLVLLLGSLSETSLAQQDIHTNYNPVHSRTHLRGIRRIPQNHYASKAAPLAEDDPISAEQRHHTVRAVPPPYYNQQQSTDKHIPTPPSFPVAAAPSAAVPIDSFKNQFGPLLTTSRSPEERRELIQRHSPTQLLQTRFPVQRAAPTAAVMPHYQHQSFGRTGLQAPRQKPTAELERQERMKARWRKIGPLIGSAGSRYQRMRLIQQKAWTHPSSTSTTTQLATTYTPSTPRSSWPVPQSMKHSSTPTQVPSSNPEPVRPTVHRTSPITAAQMAFRSTQPTQELEPFVQTNNVRRQSLRTGSAFASVPPPTSDSLLEKPSKPARIFGERTQHFASASRIAYPVSGRRITGPILTPLPEDPAPPQYPQQQHAKIQLPTPEDSGPVIIEDVAPTELPTAEPPTATEDYHHRQSLHTEKRFRLVSSRLIHRPRLKIRTHEEPRAQGKAIDNKQGPITLPELTPFQQQQSGQRFIGESSSNIPNFPSTDTFAPQLPSSQSPNQQQPGRPRQLPKVTSWGDEDVEAINGDNAPPQEESFGTGAGFESGAGFGNGAGFGGDLGHGGGSSPSNPPPGFSESFGLNGASMPLDELMAKETTTTEEPFTTTTRRPKPKTPPPNENPAVIPENSGLRPAQPPKEFQGGFGSSKGSPFSSINPNSGSGANLGSSPSAGSDANFGTSSTDGGAQKGRKGKKGRRGGKKAGTASQEQVPPKEEDYFTGDSELTPNNRGPTGDGYNAPIFPGQAVPPAEPSLSRGGDAAGARPYQPPVMDVTENTPTTLKPSSLLNILNKADVGFNQMLTNFESGAPLESAMIDILEVALGSQKLDSQAKILSHVDRTIGLDNLQRLQRWANTGGALDELKEQLVKIAKNYKPPPETNAITIPPEFEYLFKTNG
ncbi:hypothetical protein M3Y97_01114200 [Aphelenchoides bicaudatus]|nr:hypothetical protein M3Y97_01114200 [Aphelenchoides bicaudatus]